MKNVTKLISTAVMLAALPLATATAKPTVPSYHYCFADVANHKVLMQYHKDGIKQVPGTPRGRQECEVVSYKVDDYHNYHYYFTTDIKDPLTHVVWKGVKVVTNQ